MTNTAQFYSSQVNKEVSILADSLWLQLILEYVHHDEMWHCLQSVFVRLLAMGVNKFLAKFQRRFDYKHPQV